MPKRKRQRTSLGGRLAATTPGVALKVLLEESDADKPDKDKKDETEEDEAEKEEAKEYRRTRTSWTPRTADCAAWSLCRRTSHASPWPPTAACSRSSRATKARPACSPSNGMAKTASASARRSPRCAGQLNGSRLFYLKRSGVPASCNSKRQETPRRTAFRCQAGDRPRMARKPLRNSTTPARMLGLQLLPSDAERAGLAHADRQVPRAWRFRTRTY